MRTLFQLVVAMIITGWFVPVSAMQFQGGEKIVKERHEIVTDDWYAGGEVVSMYGSALQDVFVAASQAIIWGVVTQDLNVIASKADIKGELGDDLRIIASEATLASKVTGSVLFLGNTLVLQPDTRLSNDLAAFGREIVLDGTIQGPVTVHAEKVIIGGTIMSDVTINTNQLVLRNNAKIFDKLNYHSSKAMERASSAYIQGSVNWQRTKPNLEDKSWPFGWQNWFAAGKLFYRITIFIALLAVGLILLLLVPQTAMNYTLVIRERFWASLGWGAVTFVAIPILLIIFLVTLLGIPMAIVLAILYLMLILLARMAVAYLIGNLILKNDGTKTSRNILAYVSGFLILSLVGMIPFLGGLVNLISVVIGLGAIWFIKNYGVEKKELNQAPAVTVKKEPTVSTGPEPVKKAVAKKTKPDQVAIKANWEPSTPAFMQQGKADKRPSTKKKVAKKKVVKKAEPAKVKTVTKKKTLVPVKKKPVKKITKPVKKSVKKVVKKATKVTKKVVSKKKSKK